MGNREDVSRMNSPEYSAYCSYWVNSNNSYSKKSNNKDEEPWHLRGYDRDDPYTRHLKGED
ncbi:MAG: hypothetical protein WCO05_03035 [Candidatus Moraniibacteriota bacterium]|jgi:hypothetical protein